MVSIMEHPVDKNSYPPLLNPEKQIPEKHNLRESYVSFAFGPAKFKDVARYAMFPLAIFLFDLAQASHIM